MRGKLHPFSGGEYFCRRFWGRQFFLLFFVVFCCFPALFLTGCASTAKTSAPFLRPAGLFPADGMLVQRGLFTIIGRQFAINGYLAMNSDGARRLIVTETFGNVMADVLVKPDGTVFVLQSSRLFPEKYIRKQMVPDLECLFGPETVTNCPATMPE